MNYTVHIEERFEAAHWLPGHPKCGECHGHSYRVEVEISGYSLDSHGMLIDFGRIKPKVRRLVEKLDHKTLNGFFEIPTCEHVAQFFWEHLLDLPVTEVKVWETATAWASVQPSISMEWFAGFLEGDGCFSYRSYKTNKGQYSVQPMIIISQQERAVLERLRDALRELGIAAHIASGKKARANNLRTVGYRGCRRLVRRIGHLMLSHKRRLQLETFIKVFELSEETTQRSRFAGSNPSEVRQKLIEAGWPPERMRMLEGAELKW